MGPATLGAMVAAKYGDRLKWIFFVYLPLMCIGSSVAVLALAGMHLATHPEEVINLCWTFILTMPGQAWEVLERLGRASFERVFRAATARSAVKPAALYLPAAPAHLEIDPSRAWLILLALIAGGWILSAPRPARH